jgi:hypothetical protein
VFCYLFAQQGWKLRRYRSVIPQLKRLAALHLLPLPAMRVAV